MFHHQLAAILAAAALTLSANVYAAETPQPSEALSPVPFAAGVEKDGKWGALDASGKVVIPLSYDKEAVSLSDSEDQEADLASQAGRDNLIEVSKGKLRGFYNREGKVIVPVSYESRSVWKDNALAVKLPDSKIRFYREDGTVISDHMYDQVSDFQGGSAIVKLDGKYGYLFYDGKEIAPLYQEARWFAEGLAPVKMDGKWGVINQTGAVVIEPSYKDSGPSFSSGLLAVKNKENLWGFINKENTPVVPFSYEEAVPVFSEHLTAVKNKEGLWGFINDEGTVAVKPQFKRVMTEFSEDLAGVKTIDGGAYIKPDGTIAFMADYDMLFPFEDGLAEVRKGEVREEGVVRRYPVSIGIGWGWGHWLRPHHHHRYHSGWGFGIGFPLWDPWGYEYGTVPTVLVKRGYIDNTGKVIASTSNARVFPASSRGILVFNNDRYGWENRSGTFIAHIAYKAVIPVDEAGILICRNDKGDWGVLSMDDGKELVPFSYDEIKYLGSSILSYKQDGKYGILDKDGKVISAPLYREMGTASCGLIPVKDDAWKVISYDGSDVIVFPKKISQMTSFMNDRAGVKVDGKWGLIDTKGNWIVSPTYDNLKFFE
ncbi:WG repeat-containing protein [Dialister hominis]|jgi:hypothetical protein|uniref:WG repeat-containing protein n=1 Tax=Dialister hominis TaxID=2582419 RepID=UPI003AF0D88B